MSISKKQWIEKMKEKLQTGELTATDVGEDLYRVGSSGENCSNYLVCVHDPQYCIYRSVPEKKWKEDAHAKDIESQLEELKDIYDDREVVVHSTDEVFSDYYDSISSAFGEEELLNWVR